MKPVPRLVEHAGQAPIMLRVLLVGNAVFAAAPDRLGFIHLIDGIGISVFDTGVKHKHWYSDMVGVAFNDTANAERLFEFCRVFLKPQTNAGTALSSVDRCYLEAALAVTGPLMSF